MSAQNTKYGYMTIGTQTSDTSPVQTNQAVARVDGDIMKTTEIVKNSSIQNIYNNSSAVVDGNTTTEWSINMELSPVDIVRFLYGVLGAITSTDVSSATDGSVYKHQIDHGLCQLPAFSIEQKNGWCGGGASQPDGQNTMISRAFGCKVDKVEISIEEGILKAATDVKAYGAFDVAFLTANITAKGTAKTITGVTWASNQATFTSNAHGYTAGTIVKVAGMTPSGYNGTYKIVSVATNTFVVAKTTNPGVFSAGGTATKQAMATCNTGGVKGLVAGDTMRAFERSTSTYEQNTLSFVDEDNDVLAFDTDFVSALFTVANNTKFELVAKTISYGTPQLFGFKNVKVKTGTNLTLAATGTEYDLNTMKLTMNNNIETKFGTKYNTIKETGGDYMMELGLLFNDLVIRDQFRKRSEQAMIIEIDNGTVISGTDTNNATYKIKIEIPRFVYETREAPTASGGLIEETATGLILHSTAEGYSVRVSVWNNKNNTYYGV